MSLLSRTVRGPATLDRWQPPEELVLVVTGLAVGLASGLGAVGFRLAVQATASAAVWLAGLTAGFARPVALALLPALGGLLVALIGRYVAAEAQGGGIPQVMEAVALRGGRIRPRVS
ncbi:MAG: hypothetical protein ACOYEW_07675, partial [Anaerolineae bacterium]